MKELPSTAWSHSRPWSIHAQPIVVLHSKQHWSVRRLIVDNAGFSRQRWRCLLQCRFDSSGSWGGPRATLDPSLCRMLSTPCYACRVEGCHQSGDRHYRCAVVMRHLQDHDREYRWRLFGTTWTMAKNVVRMVHGTTWTTFCGDVTKTTTSLTFCWITT